MLEVVYALRPATPEKVPLPKMFLTDQSMAGELLLFLAGLGAHLVRR
jgi:hypothetical protein